MRIMRYWGRGTAEARDPRGGHFPVSCWRGSETSRAEAERLAREAALALAQQVSRDGRWPDRYGYAEHPLREEIVRQLVGDGGTCPAVITRNSYGSLILNTVQVMFADLDFPAVAHQEGLVAGLKRLLGQKTPSPSDQAEAAMLARVTAWVTANPPWGMRVYRTAAGLRCLVTHAPVAPDPDSTRGVMDALGSDPLYVRLCRAQKSFRARLTPKPWRCGQSMPPRPFPRTDANAQWVFRDWETRYAQACRNYATCRLLARLGNAVIHPEIEPLVSLHDEMTGINTPLPLA